MELSREDLLRINGLLLRLYRALTPEDHIQAMFSVISALMTFKVIAWNEFNMVTRDLKVVSSPDLPEIQEQLRALGQYAHQSPFPAHFAATGDKSWRMISDFIPIEDFHKTEFCRLGIKMMGVHQIGAVLATFDDTVFALTINRPDLPFTERERSLLNALAPHLGLSYYNTHAMDRANRSVLQLREVVQTAPAGYAYLSGAGEIVWATPKTKELWHRFYPLDAMDALGVPSTVRSWIDCQLDGVQGMFRPDASTILWVVRSDERLDIRLMPSQLGGCVLVSESVSTISKPHFVPMKELSSRENDVLQWMVEGKRNGEIATILGISPRTVDRHVAAVLSKLSVENRATAIVVAIQFAAAANQAAAQG